MIAQALDRRDFLRLLGGGLGIACLLDGADVDAQQPQQGESGNAGRAARNNPSPKGIAAWLHVASDGMVTAYTGKVEVGQNARTSLTQAVADELRMSPGSVRMVMGDTALVPFDIGTFGSLTTPRMVPLLRRAAAAARGELLELAAKKWMVDGGSLVVSGGIVTHPPSNRSVGFGELVEGRSLSGQIAESVATTAAEHWQVAGQSVPKVDGRAFVTGKHEYGSDLSVPGMLWGKVLRPPTHDAKLASVDTHAAAAIPGVVVVREGDFVGVVAPDEPTASRAIGAIQAEWDNVHTTTPTDQDVYETFKINAVRRGPGRDDARGSVETALEKADIRAEGRYTIAYIAHAPLETRSALAQWDGDRLDVWTGTQRPFGVRTELASAFKIPEESVRVRVPDTGSGYGGKHTGEAAIEAARLARATKKPLKLCWTREEEFAYAYLRPAGLIEIRAGVSREGQITAWQCDNYNSGPSGLAPPYDIADRRVAHHPSPSPLRQGSYRALASTANHFARETMVDELAALVMLEPLEFRLRNLKDPRVRAVVEAAARRFDWGRKPGEGHGFGIACGAEKGGFIAACAEVKVDPDGTVHAVRVATAFDCGAVINPDQLRNQIEGATTQGLGAAMFEMIRFEGSRLRSDRFSQYRLPRFRDTPTIDVELIDRKDVPSAGAGETPIVAIAPALGNAIFAATGQRLRSMPLVPQGVKI